MHYWWCEGISNAFDRDEMSALEQLSAAEHDVRYALRPRAGPPLKQKVKAHTPELSEAGRTGKFGILMAIGLV